LPPSPSWLLAQLIIARQAIRPSDSRAALAVPAALRASFSLAMQLTEQLELSPLQLGGVPVLTLEQLSLATPSKRSPKPILFSVFTITNLLTLPFTGSPPLLVSVLLQLLLPSIFEASAPFLFSPLQSSSLKLRARRSWLVFQGRLPPILEVLYFCLV
jgi:hypothetical protein